MKTNDAIRHFETAAALGRALGITRSAVQQWPERPPIGRQYQIEVLTGGALKADRPEDEATGDAA